MRKNFFYIFFISERIFCSHGGISPHLEHMDQIRRLQRPTPVPDEGLLCDLLWSDPEPEIRGWADSDRGVVRTIIFQKHL